MLQWYKDNAIPYPAFKKMSQEEIGEKFPIGVMTDLDEPDYLERYNRIIKQAGSEGQ